VRSGVLTDVFRKPNGVELILLRASSIVQPPKFLKDLIKFVLLGQIELQTRIPKEIPVMASTSTTSTTSYSNLFSSGGCYEGLPKDPECEFNKCPAYVPSDELKFGQAYVDPQHICSTFQLIGHKAPESSPCGVPCKWPYKATHFQQQENIPHGFIATTFEEDTYINGKLHLKGSSASLYYQKRCKRLRNRN